jgi:hypothetical protein
VSRAPGDVRNDPKNAVTKFCLVMEEHRRTEAGRVRTAREMVDFYFPRTSGVASDRIFLHIPPETRGPIVSGWGVRGAKSAIRDTDEKTRQVVQDALAAGDIDEAMFEEGVNAQTLIDWVPLTEWWGFWRTGKLTGVAIQKALAAGRELGLFDDRWFLLNVDGRGGKLKGTDTICDTLSKDQIVAWLRKIHETGDGSPAGLVNALGWETVLTKTSQEALLFALDALAKKIGLVVSLTAETELPRGQVDDDNVAVPDIPDLQPPSMGENGWQAVGEPVVTDTVNTSHWPDVSSLNAPPPSDAPPSIRFVEDAKPKVQPPPVPAARKRV